MKATFMKFYNEKRNRNVKVASILRNFHRKILIDKQQTTKQVILLQTIENDFKVSTIKKNKNMGNKTKF